MVVSKAHDETSSRSTEAQDGDPTPAPTRKTSEEDGQTTTRAIGAGPRRARVGSAVPRERSGPIGIASGDFATPSVRRRTTTQPRGTPAVGLPLSMPLAADLRDVLTPPPEVPLPPPSAPSSPAAAKPTPAPVSAIVAPSPPAPPTPEPPPLRRCPKRRPWEPLRSTWSTGAPPASLRLPRRRWTVRSAGRCRPGRQMVRPPRWPPRRRRFVPSIRGR